MGVFLRIPLWCCFFVSIFFLTTCSFGSARTYGVASYSNGKVSLQKSGFYRVGSLSDAWEPLHTKARAVAFYHREHGATLFTDALCGESILDEPIEGLLARMIGVVQERTTLERKKMTLGNSSGVFRHITGSVDGAPLEFLMVAVKKQNCVFDFVAVTPAGEGNAVKSDFMTFASGFSYDEGDQ